MGTISIVLLRASPSGLAADRVRKGMKDLFKVDAQVEATPTPPPLRGAVLGVIADGLPPIGIIDAHQPYAGADELRAAAESLEHPDVRRALSGHTAWLAVDAMGVDASIPERDRMKIYSVLAPIAAALCDEQTLLVYLPAEGRIGPGGAGNGGRDAFRWLMEGAAKGRFEDRLGLHAPIVGVQPDDQRIRSAMEEARRRLPEFCEAFERRGAACTPLVKVRFRVDGPADAKGPGSEYMWISVRQSTADGFSGTLENHPAAPSLPPKGSTVLVKLDDIVDWAYVDEASEPHGLFVDRILMSREGAAR